MGRRCLSVVIRAGSGRFVFWSKFRADHIRVLCSVRIRSLFWAFVYPDLEANSSEDDAGGVICERRCMLCSHSFTVQMSSIVNHMEQSLQFPRDENGDVFRRMIRDGDDISQPRTVDFCHVFPERKQALAFADIVDDRMLEVCISYYDARSMWEVVVRRHMIPTYQDVTSLESSLASKAELLGGEADGWGCMMVTKTDTK